MLRSSRFKLAPSHNTTPDILPNPNIEIWIGNPLNTHVDGLPVAYLDHDKTLALDPALST